MSATWASAALATSARRSGAVPHPLAGDDPAGGQAAHLRSLRAGAPHAPHPRTGVSEVAKLSAHQLQAFYGAKLTEGLSPATVAHLHAVVHRALRAAERLDLVPRNIADRVTAPRAVHHEMRCFTAEQAQAILETTGDPLEAAYVLALTAGLRQGELLGLRWRSLDLEADTLHVDVTLHIDSIGL